MPSRRTWLLAAVIHWTSLFNAPLPRHFLPPLRMAVTIQEQEIDARDVLGMLPGSTIRKHRDEIVIIGAHYDHLGRDPDGEQRVSWS